MKHHSSKLDWSKLKGKKLNSFTSLSALLSPEHKVLQQEQKNYQRKENVFRDPNTTNVKKKPDTKHKQDSFKFKSTGYKPNERYVIKPNLDAAGNYGKLIYNRPKS